MLKTPHWWYGKNNGLEKFTLYPFSLLYGVGQQIHSQLSKPVTSKIPVLCIGNITAGGGGKTPTAISIMQIAQNIGINAAFLTRGYGRNSNAPIWVEPKLHNAKQVGDEALILAKIAPTLVSKNRIEGANIIAQSNYQLIIMDDGFYHYKLHKDYTIIVIDANFGLGNNMLIPSGPLREPVKSAFNRGNAVAIINSSNNLNTNTESPLEKEIRNISNNIDMLSAQYDSDTRPPANKEQKYIAFAGIAIPEKFFNYLSELGYNVINEVSLPDHHQYQDADLTALEKLANDNNARLITTEKDYVKIPLKWQEQIDTLKISLKWPDEQVKQIESTLKSLVKNT